MNKIIIKICIYLSMLLSSSIMNSQVASYKKMQDTIATEYAQGMQKAFKLWEEKKSMEALNMFERIAKVETNEWLPKYYAAQLYINNSFGERDEKKLRTQLLNAQNYINEAMTLSNNNPELMTLQALLYTAWIVYDGQQYGMLYSNKASDLYNRALAIAPDNPRLILAKAEWDMGSAKFFGKPTQAYCKEIQKAIDLFATFKPTEAFYPTYGKERAMMLLETTCN